MSKILERPINVHLQQGCLAGFSWRRVYYPVIEILDCWRDVGCWWEGESTKIFYRVAADNGGIFELYQDIQQKTWFIYKIYD